MKKHFLPVIATCVLLLCSCKMIILPINNQDINTPPTEHYPPATENAVTSEDINEDNLSNLIAGYWFSPDAYEGEEYVYFNGDKYGRATYTYHPTLANITRITKVNDNTIDVTITYEQSSFPPFPYYEFSDEYTLSVTSYDGFTKRIYLNDGETGIYEYTFVADNYKDFMLKSSYESDIAISRAPDDYMNHDDLYTYISLPGAEYGPKIVFYSDGSITDFEFVQLDYEGIDLKVKDSIYFVGDVSPTKHIVAGIVIPEFVSFTGIRFKDANGMEKVYSIGESGRNGSIFLSEL